jgi:hypothetical protein
VLPFVKGAVSTFSLPLPGPPNLPQLYGPLEWEELARARAPEAIAELVRLALKAKSETARIAAIRELLDRGYGKATQFLATESEADFNSMTPEELRASILADIKALFPEIQFVSVQPPTLNSERRS